MTRKDVTRVRRNALIPQKTSGRWRLGCPYSPNRLWAGGGLGVLIPPIGFGPVVGWTLKVRKRLVKKSEEDAKKKCVQY